VNLLPVPIFDGGHLLLFGIERIRRRRCRTRHGNCAAHRPGAAGRVVHADFLQRFSLVFYKLKGLLGA